MSAHIRYFRPGQTMFKEGDASKSMYLIRKGSVSVRKTKGSAFVEIAKIYPNEIVGELSFFDRHPRSASAVAISEVEALEIDFASLDTIYKKVPPYLKAIFSAVANRLRQADETIRRLQKNVQYEGGESPDTSDEGPDTATVLAQTANIGAHIDQAFAEAQESGEEGEGRDVG